MSRKLGRSDPAGVPLQESIGNCYDSGVHLRLEFAMPSTATATQPTVEKDFYRIGEVSRLTNLKPFVLRYWETEFPMLEPVKSSSGHRLYRQEDVEMVLRIKRLLYDEGCTIAGARRHLREQNGASDGEPATGAGS